MEPRDERSAPEGPALDLGDLDWTIPPSDDGAREAYQRSLAWAADRYRVAVGSGMSAMALTGLTLGWWAASGTLPAMDPSAGTGALLVHIVAFFTAWVALRASVDTWQALYLSYTHKRTPPRANMSQVISVTSACIMCFQAAMVVSAILG